MSEIIDIDLRESNPYSNAEILVFDDGTMEMEREFVDYTAKEGDQYYTVREDDTLRMIAYRLYNQKVSMAQEYWDVIADANNIENPADISDLVGETLVIPEILSYKLKYNR